MDHAGAVMLASALLFLFGRIVIACVKARAVRDALRVHHTPRSSPSIFEKARALLARVPVQVHMLLVGITVSAAPWLVPASLQVESPVGNALWVAVKWSALGLVVRSARRRMTG